jgi:hypothetical protein
MKRKFFDEVRAHACIIPRYIRNSYSTKFIVCHHTIQRILVIYSPEEDLQTLLRDKSTPCKGDERQDINNIDVVITLHFVGALLELGSMR